MSWNVQCAVVLLAAWIGHPSTSTGQIHCSHKSGKYESPIVLHAHAELGELRFEMDGSFVHNGSPLWPDSMNIDRSMSLDFGAFENGKLTSRVTRFYAIDVPTNFPIVSLATKPANLWDDEIGISVRGASAWMDSSTGFWKNTNYNKKWEREVRVVFVDNDRSELLNQTAGIRVFGGMSRHRSQKSYRLVARSKYGSKRFSAPVFERREYEEFKSLILRNSSGDANKSRFRDVFATQLVKGLDLEIQESQTVTLFMNGEYMGIYNLREHIREHYLSSVGSCSKKHIDLIQGHSKAEHGDARGYLDFYNWLKRADLGDPAAFLKLNSTIDVRNYLNYLLVQIYLNNIDSMGNVRFWRADDQSPFRWILYDTDLGLDGSKPASWNYLKHRLSPVQTDWFNKPWSTTLITRMLAHDSIKADFIQQGCWLLNTVFQEKHFEQKLDSMVLHFEEDVALQQERRGELRNWSKHVEDIREYGEVRPSYMREHLKAQFDLGEMYWLEVLNETPDLGGFRINGNPTNRDSSHTGFYFPDCPLKIEWMPKDGHCSIERETVWIRGHAGDTVRLVNGFKPHPRSPYVGKLFMSKWDLGSDSLPPQLGFTSTASEELKGSKWTLLTDGGDTTFLLPSSVQGVHTIQLGGMSVPKSLRDGGWMHLLDSCALVVDSLAWDSLAGSSKFERASHLDPAWSPLLRPRADEQTRRTSLWLACLFALTLGVGIGFLLTRRQGMR